MHTISFSIFRLDKLCCYSSQKRLALFETQYKTNVILFFCFFSLVEFSLEYRICLFKKKKSHFCVCRRWWMYWCNTAQGQGWFSSYWNYSSIPFVNFSFCLSLASLHLTHPWLKSWRLPFFYRIQVTSFSPLSQSWNTNIIFVGFSRLNNLPSVRSWTNITSFVSPNIEL